MPPAGGPTGASGSGGGGKALLFVGLAVLAVVVLAVVAVAGFMLSKGDDDSTTSDPNALTGPGSSTSAQPGGSGGGRGSSSPTSSASGSSGSSGHSVVLEGEGTGVSNALMTFSDKNGGIAQESNVTLPWNKDVTQPKSSMEIYVFSVTNFDGLSGKSDPNAQVTCRIKVDGKVDDEKSAKGANAAAQCSTTVD